jgi:GT2 family glycosyltransferase
MGVNITVILCTYNRSKSLARALESAAALVLPESVRWEILVVDNNSSDQTREVTENFCRRYPGHFRYLFEPKPGKSNALNSGIQQSQSEILAFMDDDVIVEPTWLHNLTSPLHDREWMGTGGRIFPDWKSEPPRWMPLTGRYSLAPLVAFDLGSEPHALDESPFGTNMAFRREVFQKHGTFRTDLGPSPGSMVRSEDTEFGTRVLKAGERLLYVPSAVVYHEIPPSRLKKEYFLGWWLDKGRADIREDGVQANTKYWLCGMPLYLFRRLAVWTVRWMVAVEPRVRFDRKIRVWGMYGQLTECYRQSRERNQSD